MTSEESEDELRKMLIAAEKSGVSTSNIEDVFERVKERLRSEGHELQA